MVKKDRSVIVNKTYLLQMMCTFYQNHLENQLAPNVYLLLCILIDVLQNIKEVNLEKLANALPLPIEFESRRKKLQRFLSLPAFDVEKMWLPIINNWLAENFTNSQNIYLVIDRTSWSRINLIMLSIVYDQRAIPIYFELLPKLGSSNVKEQIKFLSKILPVFKNYQAVLLGDREFCSINLANWLREQNVKFCLRLKKSEFIEVENGIWTELDDLGLKPGISLFIQGVRVTKSQKISGFNLACKWKRKLHGWFPEEGWFI